MLTRSPTRRPRGAGIAPEIRRWALDCWTAPHLECQCCPAGASTRAARRGSTLDEIGSVFWEPEEAHGKSGQLRCGTDQWAGGLALPTRRTRTTVVVFSTTSNNNHHCCSFLELACAPAPAEPGEYAWHVTRRQYSESAPTHLPDQAPLLFGPTPSRAETRSALHYLSQ